MRRSSRMSRGSTAITYPYMLDDFETNSLSKWSPTGIWALASTSSMPSGAGSYCVATSYSSMAGNYTYPFGLWYASPPANFVRGSIVSAVCYLGGSPVSGQPVGIFLHSNGFGSSPYYNPVSCYYFAWDGTTMYIYTVNSDGTLTSIASASFSGNAARFYVYVNSSTAPSNANRARFELRNWSTDALLQSCQATVTSQFTSSYLGLTAATFSKGSTQNFYFDDFKITGVQNT